MENTGLLDKDFFKVEEAYQSLPNQKMGPCGFAIAINNVFYTYEHDFSQYIERETHYRMVREANWEDPSTLRLTPEQYQVRRDATIKLFVTTVKPTIERGSRKIKDILVSLTLLKTQ